MTGLKKNLNSIIFISVLSILLGGPLFYLSGTLKKMADLNFEKNQKLKIVNNYRKKDSLIPSEALLDYCAEKRDEEEKYYNSFNALFEDYCKNIPVTVPGSLKFKEELVSEQSGLREGAKKCYLSINKNAFPLGFDKYEKELPSEKDIPDLTVELGAMKKLVSFMIQSKLQTLENITIMEPRDYTLTGEKEPFSRLYPIRLTVEADFDNFMDFLYLCGKSDYIFTLEDMSVYQTKAKNTITAELLINAVIFL
ncbi:MAG: hypothetical protein ABH836_08615 [Candidatus Omnitrophota bacterium]